MQQTCKATTKAGTPCRSWAVGPSGYCLMHDPERREERRQTQQAGGSARSAARRAAKAWAAMGEAVTTNDLAPILYACMIAVKDGDMTPWEASAIATLARTAMQVTQDLEMEARLTALEEAAGILPTNVRRIA